MSKQPVFQSVAEHCIGRLRWATAIAYLVAFSLLSPIAAIGIGILSHRAGDEISRRLRDNVGNLRHLALHDSLTGLLNRTALSQLLEHKFGQGGGFALLYMDLGGFKQV